MVGLKVNAKAEQDGFLSVTLKEGNVSLLGKLPRFSEMEGFLLLGRSRRISVSSAAYIICCLQSFLPLVIFSMLFP